MTDKIVVTYCLPCEIVYNTTKPMLICGICRGQTKEIGWVEEIGDVNEG
jgi:hypothetical protein